MVFSNYVTLNQMNWNATPPWLVFNSVVKYTSAPYCTVSLPPDAVIRIKIDIQLSNKLQHFQ